MHDASVPPQQPFDAIFFDCDSTLASVEGIDILAEMNGVYDEVHKITQRCMEQTGLSPKAYAKRLELVRPKQEQMNLLGQIYLKHMTRGVQHVIKTLYHLKKDIYILSAGIRSSLMPIANTLDIPPHHVLAVDVWFDNAGEYLNFDTTSPLIHSMGKPKLIHQLANGRRTVLVGDGMSDLEAQDTVDRFIGYGGNSAKIDIRNRSDFYIDNNQLFAVLPLCLTLSERNQLPPEFQAYLDKGLEDIKLGNVFIREP